jgi:hypothetical protein
MTTTFNRPDETEKSSPDALTRLLAHAYTLNWEAITYVAIFAAAVFTRLFMLGERAMSHDESLHTRYSYNLATDGNFQHTPLMHGPILFHFTAMFYFLFGANDFTSRLYAAILGIAIVMMPLLFRRWLGKWGALLSSFMLLISPDHDVLQPLHPARHAKYLLLTADDLRHVHVYERAREPTTTRTLVVSHRRGHDYEPRLVKKRPSSTSQSSASIWRSSGLCGCGLPLPSRADSKDRILHSHKFGCWCNHFGARPTITRNWPCDCSCRYRSVLHDFRSDGGAFDDGLWRWRCGCAGDVRHPVDQPGRAPDSSRHHDIDELQHVHLLDNDS